MTTLNRREFSQLAIAFGVTARGLRGATSIDDTLRLGIQDRNIPAVAAMVSKAGKITYQGAFGTRDAASGVRVTPDSIFAIASMTKAITSVAAMQLVEQQKLKLDEPASKHLPTSRRSRSLKGLTPLLASPKHTPSERPSHFSICSLTLLASSTRNGARS